MAFMIGIIVWPILVGLFLSALVYALAKRLVNLATNDPPTRVICKIVVISVLGFVLAYLCYTGQLFDIFGPELDWR